MEIDDAYVHDILVDLWVDQVRTRDEEVAHLKQALQSSRQIGMAIGVVMGRYGLDQDTAFAALVRVSRDTNVKLRDLATSVVERRGMPDDAALSQHEAPT